MTRAQVCTKTIFVTMLLAADNVCRSRAQFSTSGTQFSDFNSPPAAAGGGGSSLQTGAAGQDASGFQSLSQQQQTLPNLSPASSPSAIGPAAAQQSGPSVQGNGGFQSPNFASPPSTLGSSSSVLGPAGDTAAPQPAAPSTQNNGGFQSFNLASPANAIQTSPQSVGTPFQESSGTQNNALTTPPSVRQLDTNLNQAGQSGGPTPAEAPTMLCYIRSCDQTITGRRLSYPRALEIVQQEEYLTAADLNVIRRRRRRETVKSGMGEEMLDYEAGSSRQVVYPPNCFTCPLCTGCIFYVPGAPGAAGAAGPPGVPGPTGSPGSPSTCCPTCSIVPYIFTLVTCLLAIAGFAFFSPPPPPPTVILLSPQQPPLFPQPPLPQGPPPPQFNVPQPGESGGGQLPIGNSSEVSTALSLVPPGLQAVSVFPPYATPRTFDAISVIFGENPDDFSRRGMNTFKDARILTHQTFSNEQAGRRNKIIPGIMQRFINSMRQRFLKTYPSRQDHYNYYPTDEQPSQNGFGQDYDQEEEEELFGFRTLVHLVVDQPCALGVTCDAEGHKLQGDQEQFHESSFYRRQTGEQFQSDGQPDCRTEVNPSGCVAQTP